MHAHCPNCKHHVRGPDQDPGNGYQWVLWVCTGNGEHSWVRRRTT